MTKTATIQAQQKWEYTELTRKTERFLLNDLNQYGQQGWELVSITHGKDRAGDSNWTAFLKRPFVAHGAADSQHAAAEKTHTLQQEQGRIEPRTLSSQPARDEQDIQFKEP